MTIRAVNPTTGETINTYEEMAPAEVARTIAQAHDAFFSWRQTSVAARAQRMQQAARILRGQATAYATLMAQEMGKPVKDGRAEVEKCAWVCDFYAEHAAHFLTPEVVETEASKSFVTFRRELDGVLNKEDGYVLLANLGTPPQACRQAALAYLCGSCWGNVMTAGGWHGICF